MSLSREVVLEQFACVTPLGHDLSSTLDAVGRDHRVINEGRVADVFDPARPRVWQLADGAIRQLYLHDIDLTLFATSKGDADTWTDRLTPPSLAPLQSISATPLLTFSSACASGLVALTHAMWMLRFGHARRILVVAAESSFHPIFTGCFKRLGVLADAGEPCRPFDDSGAGFVVSEGAAAVVVAGRKPCEGDVVVHNASLLSDAFHITSHRADGGTFRRAIRDVSRELQVDRVHAHATGTQADHVELAAIRAELGNVPVWSHKRNIGHTLGASGLLATVLSAATMRSTEIILAAGFGAPVVGVSLKRELPC